MATAIFLGCVDLEPTAKPMPDTPFSADACAAACAAEPSLPYVALEPLAHSCSCMPAYNSSGRYLPGATLAPSAACASSGRADVRTTRRRRVLFCAQAQEEQVPGGGRGSSSELQRGVA